MDIGFQNQFVASDSRKLAFHRKENTLGNKVNVPLDFLKAVAFEPLFKLHQEETRKSLSYCESLFQKDG